MLCLTKSVEFERYVVQTLRSLFMLLFCYPPLIAVMLVDGAVSTLCARVPYCLYIFFE